LLVSAVTTLVRLVPSKLLTADLPSRADNRCRVFDHSAASTMAYQKIKLVTDPIDP
jgi:hypothetical protein